MGRHTLNHVETLHVGQTSWNCRRHAKFLSHVSLPPSNKFWHFTNLFRRQPATVWHDPKLSDPVNHQAYHDAAKDVVPSTYTPVNSPGGDRRSRPISHISDGQSSISRNQNTHTGTDSQYSYSERQDLFLITFTGNNTHHQGISNLPVLLHYMPVR